MSDRILPKDRERIRGILARALAGEFGGGASGDVLLLCAMESISDSGKPHIIRMAADFGPGGKLVSLASGEGFLHVHPDGLSLWFTRELLPMPEMSEPDPGWEGGSPGLLSARNLLAGKIAEEIANSPYYRGMLRLLGENPAGTLKALTRRIASGPSRLPGVPLFPRNVHGAIRDRRMLYEQQYFGLTGSLGKSVGFLFDDKRMEWLHARIRALPDPEWILDLAISSLERLPERLVNRLLEETEEYGQAARIGLCRAVRTNIFLGGMFKGARSPGAILFDAIRQGLDPEIRRIASRLHRHGTGVDLAFIDGLSRNRGWIVDTWNRHPGLVAGLNYLITGKQVRLRDAGDLYARLVEAGIIGSRKEWRMLLDLNESETWGCLHASGMVVRHLYGGCDSHYGQRLVQTICRIREMSGVRLRPSLIMFIGERTDLFRWNGTNTADDPRARAMFLATASFARHYAGNRRGVLGAIRNQLPQVLDWASRLDGHAPAGRPWKDLLRSSERWHSRRAARNIEQVFAPGQRVDFNWDPWVPPFETRRLRIRSLCSSRELYEEYLVMHHCVGLTPDVYDRGCVDGRIRILRVEPRNGEDQKYRFTVEIETMTGRILQARRRCNAPVDKGVLKEFRSALARQLRGLSPPEPARASPSVVHGNPDQNGLAMELPY